MNNVERAAEVLRDDKHYKVGPHGEQFLTSEAARSLADAGLLMPDMPGKPDACGKWDVNGLEVNAADKDGEVLIEWEEESDYAYYGTQARTLWLNRDQVIAILAAANHAEQEQNNG